MLGVQNLLLCVLALDSPSHSLVGRYTLKGSSNHIVTEMLERFAATWADLLVNAL